ncbi:TIM-barrel domain-containing protein [Rhodohalobacter sp.]|uniref:glycoside hydrolase family 31 protein n=1 Tax=Rhodohalobacter sp. TaxID=1974210 RepID=UPI002ACD7935|nr:TIM-barrel domain-containing protein [Rhodohalobacter sp.]MDZ7755541.1 glycoside hydrolase family 31 protein [Rhodohalobacter sp.]
MKILLLQMTDSRFYRFTFLLILISGFVTVSAQQSEQFQYEVEKNLVRIELDRGVYEISFYSPEVAEVTFYEDQQSAYPPSHAVVLDQKFSSFNVNDTGDHVALLTDGLQIFIERPSGQISFYYMGEKLIEERNGFRSSEDGFEVDFNISETEILMGGGARALGMNRRGHRLQLYNRAHYGYETRSELMNYTIPMVLSSNMYAIHFDNPTIGWLDLDSQFNNTLSFEAISGRQTYQIIAGERWEKIIENYTRLTGFQPLPPRWAFGNFSSRFGYRSQDEVLKTIETFRQEDVPVDAVILDLYWFGKEVKGTMGNLAFDRDSFPEPEQMIDRLEDQGVKTVLITEPFVVTTSDRWDEAVEMDVLAKDSLGNPATYDFFFGNTGLIDVFDPEASNWFWNIYQDLIEMGVHGWWGDLGEPEVHPEHLIHHTGTANEVHNIYGHEWAKLVHEGYRENYPDVRPFNLMRAGYSGSQRFGLIPWSGDVNRTWGGLQSQPEISLQMGLQGLGYMHSDLGGFAGNLVDDEKYVRWLQYGVFQPIYRPHAQEDVPSEPVFRSRKALNFSREAIELRYRLIPYIYTLAFENSETGMPLMRPLFFEEPDNHEIYKVAGSYLFGDDMLISPIMEPGKKEQKVWFPGKSSWFDFYTGEKYRGGEQKRVETNEESIPTFIRGGAIIPTAELVQSLDNYSINHLNLTLFHDASVPYYITSVYHDDGLTYDAYKKKMYEQLHISSSNRNGKSIIRFMKEIGQRFESEIETISLTIRNAETSVESIQFDGNPVEFHFQNSTLEIKNLELSSNRHELLIQWD